MFKILVLFLFAFLSVALASDEDLLIGKSELDIEFRLVKESWPIAFRCHHYGGPSAGNFFFNIRKKKGEPIGDTNAWLVFENVNGYAGELYRNGLDWRFDWTDRNTGTNFSVTIKSGGAGYYYNWGLADDKATLNVSRTLTCK